MKGLRMRKSIVALAPVVALVLMGASECEVGRMDDGASRGNITKRVPISSTTVELTIHDGVDDYDVVTESRVAAANCDVGDRYPDCLR